MARKTYIHQVSAFMPGTCSVQEEQSKDCILQRVPVAVAQGVASYLNGRSRNPEFEAMARFILTRHGTQAGLDLAKQLEASSAKVRANRVNTGSEDRR